MTILLIEDSRFLRIAIERALVKAGSHVVSVGDGEVGLRAAYEKTPDLILLDMMLPKVTGLDVLRTLKRDARTKPIPVIVLTSLSHANEAKLVEEGAAAFFEKSEKTLQNNSADLIRSVEKLLSKAKAKGAGPAD